MLRISAVPIIGFALAFVAATVSYGPRLLASSLWSSTWGGQLCCYQLDVYEIDAATGGIFPRITVPGSGSRAGVQDFASDPIGDPTVVWSVNYNFESGYRLMSFDPHKNQLLSNMQLDNALEIRGLAIDPTSGKLYGTSMSALYEIDSTTGQATLVGLTSLRVDGALTFDLEGNLFGFAGAGAIQPVRALVRVNKSTGETEIAAEIDASPADIAVRPEDDAMYGIGFGNTPSSDYSLFRIDIATGTVMDVGPSLIRPAGLAFTLVPEPMTLGLSLAAVVGLATGGRHSYGRSQSR